MAAERELVAQTLAEQQLASCGALERGDFLFRGMVRLGLSAGDAVAALESQGVAVPEWALEVQPALIAPKGQFLMTAIEVSAVVPATGQVGRIVLERAKDCSRIFEWSTNTSLPFRCTFATDNRVMLDGREHACQLRTDFPARANVTLADLSAPGSHKTLTLTLGRSLGAGRPITASEVLKRNQQPSYWKTLGESLGKAVDKDFWLMNWAER